MIQEDFWCIFLVYIQLNVYLGGNSYILLKGKTVYPKIRK